MPLQWTLREKKSHRNQKKKNKWEPKKSGLGTLLSARGSQVVNDITKRASKPSFRHSLYVDHIGFYSAKTQYLHFLFLFRFSNLEA